MAKSAYMRGWLVRLAGGLILMLGLGACDGGGWDHTPPAGKGSIIVDNRTADGVNVYLAGVFTNHVAAYDYEYYDLQPGIWRVILDQAHGDRNWRADVDVLQGKLTILEVHDGYYYNEYDVRNYFD